MAIRALGTPRLCFVATGSGLTGRLANLYDCGFGRLRFDSVIRERA
jgi:hypothetical protein